MFKSFFSKLKGASSAPARQTATAPVASLTDQDAGQAALMHAIEEKRKTDPLIGAKLVAKEILPRLMKGMTTERGVHMESLLCVLSALAGYACQASLRAQALDKGLPETAVFMVVSATNGKKYFFGEPLNQAVAESAHSVWSLAAGAAQSNGCTTLPDLTAIFKHVTQTVGDECFGIPRIPEGHRPGDLPVNYLKATWPWMLAVVKPFYQNPSEWPLAFALAIQDAMDMGKDVITPDLALTIVMESAIPMSKVDLATA